MAGFGCPPRAMAENLDSLVREYVRQLGGVAGEDAWHSLVELGSEGLVAVQDAYRLTSSAKVREELLRVLMEYGDERAVELLADAVLDPEPTIWRAALDALVAIGGARAREALGRVASEASEPKRAWIAEAQRQIN